MSIKVLIVGSGKSFHSTRWANALSERGVEIVFVSINKLQRPVLDSVKSIVLKSSFGKLSYLLSSLELRKIIASEKPDLIHAHYSSGNGILAALSSIGLNVPFVTSLYGAEVFDFPKKSLIHKAALGFVCKRACEVLSTSEVMADEFVSHYPNAKRPTVTPFGVDCNKFTPKQHRSENALFKIGMVKKLEKKYGIDTLLLATKIIFDKLPSQELEVSIVGGGSERDYLEQLTVKLGLSNTIRFLGWMPNDEVPEYINSLDVFIVPSRHRSESFGVAAVEAQACGVPVIVSNVGGLPEVVSHNDTGIVVEADNPEMLADAIMGLINNKGMISQFGQRARQRVLENYNWDDSLNLMVSIYKNTLQQRNDC